MRQRAEDERGVAERGVFGRDERQAACTRASPVTAGSEGEVERRMSLHELTEDAAGIAGRAQDADRKFIHIQCIIIMQRYVNLQLSRLCRLCYPPLAFVPYQTS